MAMQVLSGAVTIQGSPEWLAWRLQGIGASDAPIIMGKSLYTRAYELFKHKTGKGTDPKHNPILQKIRERGKRLEPLARAQYEKLTSTTVTPLVAASAVHPFIRASFDGFDLFSGEPLEVKCPGERAHKLALSGIVPEEYVDQLQQQIFVAEADWANYYSFDGQDGVLLRVSRDQERIDQIVAADVAFWDRVQLGIWESDEWAAAATHYLLIKREKDELEAREQLARDALIALMPSGEKLREGCGVLVSRASKKGDVDYAKLLSDKGVVVTDQEVDTYRGKGSESFRIRVAKDFNLDDVDITPLQIHTSRPVVVPAAPDALAMLGKYRETVDLVI